LRLERVSYGSVDWELLDAFPDRLAYQTREWIDFVAHTQDAEPVVAALVDGSSTVGYFTGLVQRRVGLRILGSPMPGWTTAYMGFNLEPGLSRRAALESLVPFAFGDLGCAHLELRDRNVVAADLDELRLRQTPWTGLEVDLKGSEDEIWGELKAPCRTAIRKAEKLGVTVEEADGEDFAEDFYPQLEDVFSKQALVPPYGIERVRELIRHVHPTGRLLLLRARSAEGECIATGIFPGMNRTMHFLAGASWRDHQHLRPNEALMWHAMKHWKSRGVEVCDLGFALSYKRKWGGRDVHVPFLSASRYRMLSLMRDGAELAHGARQAVLGRVRGASHRQRRRSAPHELS
jgi:CelD/BcsL family acetyltransferase involved in cellulose biosynthesis